MDLTTGTAKLNQALKDLRIRWQETRQHWSDPVGQAFEDDQLAPLEALRTASGRCRLR